MSPMEVQDYTKNAIAKIMKDKQYVHTGKNTLDVSYLILSTACYLSEPTIQTKAYFTSSSYHTIILDYWFGPRGIAHCFPHKFRPHFPISSMALTAALSKIVLSNFDPTTGAYLAVQLNEEHCIKIYDKWVKRLEDIMANKYQRYFLNPIRQNLLDRGM